MSQNDVNKYENSRLIETDDKMFEKLIDFSLNTTNNNKTSLVSPKNRAKSAFDR